MDYQTFSLSIDNKIAHLQLSRPDELNSMNRAFWSELPSALDTLEREAQARVLVISSTGKHFSAGMDLSIFADGSLDTNVEIGRKHLDFRQKVLDLQAIFTRLEKMRLPVLTAIQGGCIGGAVDMVCAADSRYCTDDAFFCVQETNIGMAADLGTLQRLPSLISQGLARELVYTGRRLSASEAVTCGLANRSFPDQDSMLTGVMEIAVQIAQQSPLTIAGCKEMLNFSRDHSADESLRYMATWQAGMFQPQDVMEAMSARMEKRDTQYDDLAPIGKPI